jgi:hypothetical protein
MKSKIALSVCVASLLVQGCASYAARPFTSQLEASSIIEQKEAEGLFVAVKDLSLPRDSLRYFDRDLVAQGYVPVQLLLELDRTAECSFDVRREELKLCLRDGRRLDTVDPQLVAEAVSFSHARSVVGFLLLIPGFFVAHSVHRANEELGADYGAKAMSSIRINPNMRSYRGVVFFAIPPELDGRFSMDEAFVEIKVNKQGRAGRIGQALELPVHFGR